jgi:predicted ferric reductase
LRLRILAAVIPAVLAAALAAGPVLAASSSSQVAIDNHIFWYISRASALLAFILLFISIILGSGMKIPFLARLTARWENFDLHQFTAVLASGLIIVHIFSLLGDNYLGFNLQSLLVPLASPYRTIWIALGVIGFYVLIVIAVSSFLRRHINRTIWKVIHVISYILFFIILYHSIRSGTDSSTLWVRILYVISGTCVAFLGLWRLLIGRECDTIGWSNHN